MADLIDREAVIDIITERCLVCNAVVCTKCKTAKMQMKIENLDTVDAEPVRHGRWRELARYRDNEGCILTDQECSECLGTLIAVPPEDSFMTLPTFCCMCGAKMDGKE